MRSYPDSDPAVTAAPERAAIPPPTLPQALWRGRWLIVIPTLLAAIVSIVAVGMMKPVYRSETRLLIESVESPYTRASTREQQAPERAAIDDAMVASQVQVLTSRDIAQMVAARLDLASKPEFNEQLRSIGPFKRVMIGLGLADNPMAGSPQERVMSSYYQRLLSYAVDKSRILVVQFDSQSPQLAADVANAVVEAYLSMQQQLKKGSTEQATLWLGSEIDKLRKEVAEADAAVENFRAGAGLFMSGNNTTLSQQQLAEANAQMAAARSQSIDAQTRARMLRDMLKSGRPLESSDINTSDVMRRLTDQRAATRAMLAEQSATLGPRHPRIIELKAQLSGIEVQVRSEAEKVIRSLDNDVKIAAARLESLGQMLDQVKQQAGSANEQDVKLRALEREAKTKRDQLEMLLARGQDASIRNNVQIMAADARIISRAQPSNVPFSPKKLPIVLISTLSTFAVCLGLVMTGALFRAASGHQPHMIAYIPANSFPVASAANDIHDRPAPAAPKPVAALVETPPPPPSDAAGEHSLQQLATRLATGTEATRIVGLVPAVGSEAAMRAAMALGRLLVAEGRSCALIDANAAHPCLNEAVDVDGKPGLVEVLGHLNAMPDALIKDSDSGLAILPFGLGFMSQRDILGHPGLGKALSEAATLYDQVLVLLGPVKSRIIARKIPRLCQETVVVAENGVHDPAAMAAHDELANAGVKTAMLAFTP